MRPPIRRVKAPQQARAERQSEGRPLCRARRRKVRPIIVSVWQSWSEPARLIPYPLQLNPYAMISIIIPAKNEAVTLWFTIHAIRMEMDRDAGEPYEIIVVD